MPNKKEIVDVINLKLDETFISDVNNYKFTAQDSLVAWFDLDSTLIDQSANSGQIASLNYRRGTANNNSDAVISKEAFNIDGLGKKIVENFWALKLIRLPQDIFL